MFTSTKQRECCLVSATASARQIAAKGGSISGTDPADRFFDFCICLLQACRQSGQDGHRQRGRSCCSSTGSGDHPITSTTVSTPTPWGRSRGPAQTRHSIRPVMAVSPFFCGPFGIPGSSGCGTTFDFGRSTFEVASP
jgi:hypothetical protein